MKYEDWRKQRQDSFSKLPLKAAFSQKQFEEMMSEWGLTTSEEDLQKLQPLGGGAYCLKTDYTCLSNGLRSKTDSKRSSCLMRSS